MNSKQKIAVYGLFITIIGLIIYLLLKTKSQGERINELEKDRLRLQKFLFQKYGNSPTVAVSEINRLIEQYNDIHPETVMNLSRARDLYLQGYGEEAVKKLVVIIENKLKLKFEQEQDGWFNSLSPSKKRFVKFEALFNRAKEISLFNELQFSIAHTAVKVRNGESHHEGYQDEQKRIQICILGSIEIIDLLVPKTISASLQLETTIKES